ncbi:hypothetical protein [Gemmata sp.]|uniref:hypothetical protein n=1 Tax=Gemmata sp. TaxID=1914242 RepID=UPI003F72BE80
MAKSRNSKLCKIGDTLKVDVNTGEAVPVEGGGFRMPPGPPGTCEWCCVAHQPDQPHNQQSLPYQMRFHAINKRWPTWTDAMAHCSAEVKAVWRAHLVEMMRANGMEVPPDLRDDWPDTPGPAPAGPSPGGRYREPLSLVA